MQRGHPAPGDYNGDGLTDRAVVRAGRWYVQNQGSLVYGNGTDIPLPLAISTYQRFFG